MSRAICANCAAAEMLLLLATLLAATAAYCLLHCLLLLYTACCTYVCEYGLLLLTMHIPERLAATCYLLSSLLTKYKTGQET